MKTMETTCIYKKSIVKGLIFVLCTVYFLLFPTNSAHAYEKPAPEDRIASGSFSTSRGSFTWEVYQGWDMIRKTIVSGEGGFELNYDFDCSISGYRSPFVTDPGLSKHYLSNILVFKEGITDMPEFLLDAWYYGKEIWWFNIQELYLPRSMTYIGASNISKIKNYVTIYCYEGSYAHQYCEENNYRYKLISDASVEVPVITPEVTAPNPVTGIEYDGKSHTLIQAGNTSAGKLVYSLSKNGTYSQSLPSAAKPGNYHVYYKVIGDDGTALTEPKSVSVQIKPQKPVIKGYTNTNAGIKLSWNSVPEASGYYIYKNGVLLAKVTSGTQNTYTDKKSKSAKTGASATYRIFAYCGSNLKSVGSEPLSALRVNAPTFKVTAGKNTAKLSITKPVCSSNLKSEALGYVVYRSTKSTSGFAKIKTISSKSGAYTNKSLKSGKKYYYKLKAYINWGGKKIYSDYSKVYSATIK